MNQTSDDEHDEPPANFVSQRRWSLLKVAAIALLEGVILRAYIHHGAADHYALHPLVGTAVALSLLIALRAYGVPVREEILVCYGFASYARIPDFIFQFGPEHRSWMDIFLLHLSFDDIIDPAIIFFAAQVAVLLLAYVRLKYRMTWLVVARQ